MRHRPARRFGGHFAAVLALAAAAGATSAVTSPATAAAEDAIQCAASASVFTAVPDGRLFLWHHDEPETGAPSWRAGSELGTGWGSATWGGPDGRIYTISETGELHRRRWQGTSWEGGGPGAYTVIGTGFATYRTPAYRPRFTVDSLGHFYYIDTGGFLRWRAYNETTGTSATAILDAGWNGYDMITAAGNGVIYARSTSGFLYRYEYHHGSQRLSGSTMVGSGDWGGFTKVFSPGGDVLYAVRPTGQMLWYRYNPSTQSLVAGSGREVASGGWGTDPATVATTDACRWTAANDPQRPFVPVDRTAGAALAKTSNGYLQYGYVDNEGRLVHGEIRDLYNVDPNGFAAFPGYAGFTGKPSYAENQDGQLRLYAHGTDSDTRGALQSAPGTWTDIVDFRGRMRTDPQLVRTANDLVTFVALDANGYIWTRPQRVVNGSIHAWRRNTYQRPLPVAPAGPLAAVATGTTIRLTALGVDGVNYTYSIAAEPVVTAMVPPSPWESLGNPAGSLAAAVTMPNGDVLRFVRGDDGQVWTRRTGAAAWTVLPAAPLPGMAAAGAPSAIMAPNGTVQVVVRGTDGFVYRTGQANPGSATWLPWSEVTHYEHETASDPTLSLAADTWVILCPTPGGAPRGRVWVRVHPPGGGGGGYLLEVPVTVRQ
ncbi:tachylectin-related carbohydrate-binding protein [Actinosynnema sp. NPDC059335]|uniref:tachylectin-related carbohydrate-binding protein n=1 Tax=Actinosynnema sp. NPDC059335 TaxID=3346804 RepID=UPI00366FD593